MFGAYEEIFVHVEVFYILRPCCQGITQSYIRNENGNARLVSESEPRPLVPDSLITNSLLTLPTTQNEWMDSSTLVPGSYDCLY